MKNTRKPILAKAIKTLSIKCQPPNFSPGPGDYDISLPIIKPNYSAIKKKNDIIIIKVNHHGQSASFKPGTERFSKQKFKSPGPGRYSMELKPSPKKLEHKQYSKRYKDLVQFMYHDRSKIQPIPDYKVEYSQQYEQSLKYIKNSYRRLIKKSSQTIDTSQLHKNSSCKRIPATKSIVSINSSKDYDYSQANGVQLPEDISFTHQQNRLLKTIDYPTPVNQLTNTRRALKKQDNLLMHRQTFFNRNMLGMMVSQSNSLEKIKRRQKQEDQ